MSQRAVVVSLLFVLGSCARKEADTTQRLTASKCDGGHATDGGGQPVPDMAGLELLQVKPGYNPDGIVYTRTATVTVNGTVLPETFTISSDGPVAQTTISIASLAAGDALTVSATFTDDTGAAPVSCTEAFVAAAPGSLNCGPIEITYQPVDATCVMVCN